jgi:hypothetical protein
MKRIVNLIAAVLLVTILCMSCSKHVCPAYSDNPDTEKTCDTVRG